MSKEKQRKLEEINRPMNEELFNNIEKQYQELVKVKHESEQIEEMTKIIHGYCKAPCRDGGCQNCFEYKRAEALYNAGYRKQSEGEWRKRTFIIFDSEKVGYRCLECNTTWDTPTHFCPNCGAKMKGGAE